MVRDDLMVEELAQDPFPKAPQCRMMGMSLTLCAGDHKTVPLSHYQCIV